jgi:hypothetical protein
LPWSVRYHTSLGVIELIFSGTASASELTAATQSSMRVQAETGADRVLCELSAVDHVSASILDLLELPETLYVEQGASRRTRIALVVPQSAAVREAARFYETACMNRGWQARIFSSRGSAMEWLAEGRAESA